MASNARREQATYKQFLLELLQAELADRDVRRQQRLVRAAKFPRSKLSGWRTSTSTRTRTSPRRSSRT
ncbi:ATP-binding protein [Streptomyces sp. NBC_00984]|uniref:ATP-binding protein n=1 Tax=Streptomyces sp. NBC_00984 TaxID=2903700 RepID=UPI00386AB6C4